MNSVRGALRSIEGIQPNIFYTFLKTLVKLKKIWYLGRPMDPPLDLVIVVWTMKSVVTRLPSGRRIVWNIVAKGFFQKKTSVFSVFHFLEQNLKRWSGKESVNIRPFINFSKRVFLSISGSKHKRENNCSYSCHYQLSMFMT